MGRRTQTSLLLQRSGGAGVKEGAVRPEKLVESLNEGRCVTSEVSFDKWLDGLMATVSCLKCKTTV